MVKSPERIALEDAANALEVSFAATIGDEKLQERVDAAKEAAQGTGEETLPEPEQKAPTSEVSNEVDEKPVYLDVIGPPKGFWRAGRQFGAEKTTIPVSELSDTQLTALLDEPKLITVLR